MKKIKFITICVAMLLCISISACGNSSSSSSPQYKGMVIQSSYNYTSSIDDVDFETDIEDLYDIEIENDNDIKYYVNPNDVFNIVIKLSNPSNLEIQSFTLNGQKYANSMFEEGSDTENLYLKVTAPETPGYIEYTLDEIKYIDGTDIKDVELNTNKTIKAGVKYTTAPFATISNTDITTTSISLTVNLNDESNICTDKVFYLSNGNEIIKSVDLTNGTNKIVIDNLSMANDYQYAIVASYDLCDGNELSIHTLDKGTFSTLNAFKITSDDVSQTSISFILENVGNTGTVTDISLFNENNELVEKLQNLETRSFTNLLSNTNYFIKVEFNYIKDNETINSYITLKFTTLAKIAPVVSIEEKDVSQNSFIGTINLIDEDSIYNLDSIDLYLNEELVATQSTLKFNNLDSFTEYLIKVNYNYDLNDGSGVIEKTLEYTFKTSPVFTFESCKISNTSAIFNGDVIYLRADIYNPSGAEYTKVVVNGMEFEIVSNTSTANRMFVEIINEGQFGAGDLTLTIDEIIATIDGVDYYVEIYENNSVDLFINGSIEALSVTLLNSNLEAVEYGYSGEQLYALITFDNETGYTIDKINDVAVNGTYIDQNNYYYPITLSSGWRSISISSIEYSNEHTSGTLTYSSLKKNVYIIQNDQTIYISTADDLLDMNQGRYYELTNDIDLEGIQWQGNEFSGVFNGNGYSIKNMSVVSTFSNSNLYLGLFSKGNGIIENLTIDDALYMVTLNSTDNKDYKIYYGGLIAYTSSTLTLNNCNISEDSLISITNNSGESFVGGLVGFSNNSLTFNNCYNSGNVSGESYVGGLVGYSNNSLTFNNCYNSGDVSANNNVGGLVGSSSSLYMDNCYNSGDVSSNSGSSGGLVGNSNNSSTINNSFNSGDVSSNSGNSGGLVGSSWNTLSMDNCYNSGDISGKSYVGGLVGYSSSSSLTINNCYNSGDISGESYVGGLVGYYYYSSLTINNCYNSGDVSGESFVGGLVGYYYSDSSSSSSLTMNNCYNSGDISGKDYVGGLVGFSSSLTMNNCFYIGTTDNKFVGNSYDSDITITNCYYNNQVLRTKDFYVNTLLWDQNTWDFNNEFPTLK